MSTFFCRLAEVSWSNSFSCEYFFKISSRGLKMLLHLLAGILSRASCQQKVNGSVKMDGILPISFNAYQRLQSEIKSKDVLIDGFFLTGYQPVLCYLKPKEIYALNHRFSYAHSQD